MNTNHSPECPMIRRAVSDTLEVISGKWKLLIIYTLSTGPYRFSELVNEIGITPRMLSKELSELEMNHMVSRTVHHTRPVTVEYSITDHGRTLWKVIDAMKEWGMEHRKKVVES